MNLVRNAVPNSACSLLANAEVDSMGGVIDGGLGLDSNSSSLGLAIEKAQAELRKEYDVREERKRELEFLEKGGNPLDFKLGTASSTSLQSTSVADQQREQFATSEAKGSSMLAASPHADSVDSNGRLGAVLCKDPNCADNLLNFGGEEEMNERKRSPFLLSKKGSNARLGAVSTSKEADTTTSLRIEVKGQAYARRNRSRSSRDSAHAHSSNLNKFGNLNIPSDHSELKGVDKVVAEGVRTRIPVGFPACKSETGSPNGNDGSRSLSSDNPDMDVSITQGAEIKNELVELPNLEVVTETRQTGNNQFSQGPGEQDANNVVLVDEAKVSVLGGHINGDSEPTDAVEKSPNLSNCCCPAYEVVNDVHKDDQSKERGLLSSKQRRDSIVNEQSGTSGLNLEMLGCSTTEGPKVTTPSEVMVSVADVSNFKESIDPVAIVKNDTADNEMEAVDLKTVHVNDTKVDVQHERKADVSCSSIPNERLDNLRDDISAKPTRLSFPAVNHPISLLSSKNDLQEPLEVHYSVENNLEVAQEDAILEKARVIEVNRKRFNQIASSSFYSDRHQKSHWDFVLEEIAWLANDFMQERLWKIAAASRISHLVASTSRSKLSDVIMYQNKKLAAHSLAKAVIEFWDSAKRQLSTRVSGAVEDRTELPMSENLSTAKDCQNAVDKSKHCNVKNNGHSTEGSSCRCRSKHNVLEYAIRFLQDNIEPYLKSVKAYAPRTPDRFSDFSIVDLSETTKVLQEDLLFVVPFGAMENYRDSVESLWMHYEKIGNTIQSNGCLGSLLDSASGPLGNEYEEDEGETGIFCFPDPADKFSRSASKKRENFKKYMPKTYEFESESPFGSFAKNIGGNSHFLPNGKRSSNPPHVGSIPIKRARTAARHRISGPLTSTPTHMPTKTDVSSGDTSSYQDDQSSLHLGFQMRKNSEVDSSAEYGKQLPFYRAGLSSKHKKKKKPKHLGNRNSLHSADSANFTLSAMGSTFDCRWQGESTGQHEQREMSKKKLETRYFDSNANNGTHGLRTAKKLKLLKQQPDVSPEVMGPVAGSFPSVTSQTSNLGTPNRIMKLIAHGPGKKGKTLKLKGGSSGAEGPWSILEDQALVVLVHDMGPNWELVSDVMNSALHFRCIFRMPKECKEHHKTLMDGNSGDAADSAEDSGSSQPYPSTLPGIPKGRATQLLQHLQRPLEEDMLKVHFEKIIEIGQRLHTSRCQNNNLEAKQIIPVHGSHVIALSQVCPSILHGTILTPLDLCYTTTSSPDVHSLGFSGSHVSGVPVSSHQGSLASSLSSSVVKNMTQGSPAMVLGNGPSSNSAASSQSSRYACPRLAPLPTDEQQRIQPYNQLISGRNMQQSNMPSSGVLQVGNDRGVQLPPGNNGAAMPCGMNRGIGPRPGFQGMGSAPMLNMVSPGSIMPNTGMLNPVTAHVGPVSDQGNSIKRPRDTSTAVRPGWNAEDQRHTMMQEYQMQVPMGNCQGTPAAFSGISTAFTNPAVTSSFQKMPIQSQQQIIPQPHAHNGSYHPNLQVANSGGSQQRAFAHLAKDRPMQRQFMPQQQRITSSNPSISHPPRAQLHQSVSLIQNGSSIPPVSLPITTVQHSSTKSSSQSSAVPSQPPPKHDQVLQSFTHGQLGGSVPNQVLKQRSSQQQLQKQRPHLPQHRQPLNPQSQANLMKGLGKGNNTTMHQSLHVDIAHSNNFSPGTHVSEKDEPVMQQTMYQPKQLSRTLPQKQVSMSSTHVDSKNQCHGAQVQSNQTLFSFQPPTVSPPLSRQTSQSPPATSPTSPASSQWKVDSPSHDSSVTGRTLTCHLMNNGKMSQQSSRGSDLGQTAQSMRNMQSLSGNTMLQGSNGNGQGHQQSQIQLQQPMDARQLYSPPSNSGPG